MSPHIQPLMAETAGTLTDRLTLSTNNLTRRVDTAVTGRKSDQADPPPPLSNTPFSTPAAKFAINQLYQRGERERESVCGGGLRKVNGQGSEKGCGAAKWTNDTNTLQHPHTICLHYYHGVNLVCGIKLAFFINEKSNWSAIIHTNWKKDGLF